MTPIERAREVLTVAVAEVDAELWKQLKQGKPEDRADIMAESDVLDRLSRRIRAQLDKSNG